MHEIKYMHNSFYDSPDFKPLSAFIHTICKDLNLIPREEYVRLFAIRSPDWIGAMEYAHERKKRDK